LRILEIKMLKRRTPSKVLIERLASNIRKFRKDRNISQERLASLCNLHRTYIGAIERGERNISLSTLEAIANALDVCVTELLSKKSSDN